jgi:NCAIR mutase (PurE)-related protein
VNADRLQQLLTALASGEITVTEAISRLRTLPFEQLPFATLDHHRSLRCGHPEVIFCAGKTPEQVVEIAAKLAKDGEKVLATRASGEHLNALHQEFPQATIDPVARAALINPPALIDPSPSRPPIAVVSAGTSDSPVAAEALITLRSMSVPSIPITDVGIAGLHRLLASPADIAKSCCAIVAIAGMEGALPSVIGGLVPCPVFAVPTSSATAPTSAASPPLRHAQQLRLQRHRRQHRQRLRRSPLRLPRPPPNFALICIQQLTTDIRTTDKHQ